MNILYLIAAPNIYGGTPKKLLETVKHSCNRCIVYFWTDAYKDKQELFREAGAITYTGAYGYNIFKHIRSIANIIENHSIEIVQTQFSFGEVLGFFAKLLKPKVKLVIAFVGNVKQTLFKKCILRMIYNRVDAFIYVSEYVRREKLTEFPALKKRSGRVIFNGTCPLPHSRKPSTSSARFKTLAVSGLVDLKNIATLVRAIGIIVQDVAHKNIELTVVGDGPERGNLEKLIKALKLEDNVFLLGYRDDVGDFLYQSNLFAHPSVAEGFGIAVIEAMMAGVPVLAAKAGSLPELIDDGETGLLIEPYDVENWAAAIKKLMQNPELAKQLADNGKSRAINVFSIEQSVSNYEGMYKDVVDGKF